MRPIEKLQSQGYVVLYKAMNIDAVNALRIIAHRNPFAWADEDPSRPPGLDDSSQPSAGRVYAEPPPVVATVLLSMLPRYYRTLFPDAVVTWFFSKTHGGTPDQPIHLNFPLSRFAVNPIDVSSVSGCMIIAAMDDTIINGYGWNHQVAFQSKRPEINLQMGDIFFIRGYFIHSQTGYAYNNHYVHAFKGVLPPGNPWRRAQLIPLYEDEPHRDEDSFCCFVWDCAFVARNQRGLNRHVRCSHNFLVNNVTWREPTRSSRFTENGSTAAADILDEGIPLLSLSFSVFHGDGRLVDMVKDKLGERESLVVTDSDGDFETVE